MVFDKRVDVQSNQDEFEEQNLNPQWFMGAIGDAQRNSHGLTEREFQLLGNHAYRYGYQHKVGDLQPVLVGFPISNANGNADEECGEERQWIFERKPIRKRLWHPESKY